MNRLRSVLRAGGLLGWMAWALGAHAVRRRLMPPERHVQLLADDVRRWARRTLELAGAPLTVLPGAPLAASGARLVVANHRSPFDIPALLACFAGGLLSRADVSGWPLVGAAARMAGTIFVDREDRSSGARAIRAIRKRLLAGGTVSVFPEGTTFEGDEVRPFRRGAFVAAARIPVEVVPVGLAYPTGTELGRDESMAAWASRIAVLPRTPIFMAVGHPVRIEDDADAAAERLRALVQEQVLRARAGAAATTSYMQSSI